MTHCKFGLIKKCSYIICGVLCNELPFQGWIGVAVINMSSIASYGHSLGMKNDTAILICVVLLSGSQRPWEYCGKEWYKFILMHNWECACSGDTCMTHIRFQSQYTRKILDWTFSANDRVDINGSYWIQRSGSFCSTSICNAPLGCFVNLRLRWAYLVSRCKSTLPLFKYIYNILKNSYRKTNDVPG